MSGLWGFHRAACQVGPVPGLVCVGGVVSVTPSLGVGAGAVQGLGAPAQIQPLLSVLCS